MIHKYEKILLNEFYLDIDDITIKRKKDGYLNRFKKDDVATVYLTGGVTSGGKPNTYYALHIPSTRSSIKATHLLYLLRNAHLPKNFIIDHIDGNALNDKRCNLRITNQQVNNCNRCKRSDNTSGITGIRWSNYHNHYVIRKTIKGKRISRSRKTLSEAIKVLESLSKMDTTYTKRHGK